MAFEDFQQEVSDFANRLEQTHFSHFKDVFDLTLDALHLMEADVYLSSQPTQKDKLLARFPRVIEQFLADEQISAIGKLIQLLSLLSADIISLKYDAPWLHEERHILFKDTLPHFFSHLERRLKTPSRGMLSVEAVASAMFSISVWNFKPCTRLAELLIEKMEEYVHRKTPVPEKAAYQFLQGVVNLSLPHVITHTPKRAEFFATLAEKALPFILQGEKPFKMFPVQNLNLSFISRLKLLLPQPDLSKHPQLLLFTVHAMQAKHGYANMNELLAWLPAGIVPHQKLLVTLDSKEMELFDDSDRVSKKWYGARAYRKGNKTYFSTDTYVKQIKLMHQSHHPKGTQWLILRFSQAMMLTLQNSGRYITYSAEDIKNYLKALRVCVWDINIAPIRQTIAKLCDLCVDETHFHEVDLGLSIDLLWINMVLSVTTNDPQIAYSRRNQRKLFRKVNSANINEEQARALFEIQTMQWHGKTAFMPRLTFQMQAHLKNFSKGANPSGEEKLCFERMKQCLPIRYQIFLAANVICKQTGYEIDITLLGNPKIAIHVEGPHHVDPITRLPTKKTVFRDRCLEKAGWQQFHVHLVDPLPFLKQLDTIIKEIMLLLNETALKEMPHGPRFFYHRSRPESAPPSLPHGTITPTPSPHS